MLLAHLYLTDYVIQTDVQLPLPVEKVKGELYPREVAVKIQLALREKTLFQRNAYGAHYFHGGAWWVRASAQAWIEVSSESFLYSQHHELILLYSFKTLRHSERSSWRYAKRSRKSFT